MLLTIDIGNTSTSIGIFDGGNITEHWRTETRKDVTADQLAVTFKDLLGMSDIGFDKITGVVISNVVPSIQHAIINMSRRYLQTSPVVVDHLNAGINIEYPNPPEIGADRLVNAVSAYEKYKDAVIVIDFGTATTFDYVDAKRAYRGGVIVPGIAISNEALHRHASKLPRVGIVKSKNIIGKTTVEAIQSGLYNGYTGMVSYLVEKMSNEVGFSPKVIATGGLASLITEELGIETDKFLTLNGLRIIWENNLRKTLK